MAGVYAIPAKPDDEEDGEDGAAPRRDDPEPG